ncbi:LacI family DNA-binding transcriptional regulator [Agrobacterium vitis]|uniref:LacI family DNA-binding transcriptional regulator n=1 Tax=Agrobacterium vitis TaxID=373 RepID=UPI001573CC58|nr:LacI family DNA-binding transcriptional regulator [Agrobacterium vitis]NSZ19506.1 LacI family DNA-binding transcriptional regulator [Agrobacterium vitis]QZO06820.1 LacI family DNA-binding transcriptional regulator [Agrobacterium vitis]UJL91552.1 LacI family DNA-binding transcriptional regulator [Agrobacterium vitis]
MRPTAKDLAEAAGVSLATVDRVLNERPNVSKKALQKVNDAIEKIGFVRNPAAVLLARNKTYRFQFVLPQKGDEYLRELLVRVEEAGQTARQDLMDVSVKQLATDDPYQLSRYLSSIDEQAVNGIAVMAPESPQVRDALGRLMARGIQVVQFMSGQENLLSADFVGVDNYAAGATAGRLIGRFLPVMPAKIIVIAETMVARDSIERRRGFDSILNVDFPHLRTLPSLETYGDEKRTATIIRQVLEHNREIRAAYIMSPECRIPILAISEYADPRALTVVVHERTPFSEHALRDNVIDAIIAQDPGHAVRSAIRILRARTDMRAPIASQEKIRIEVLLKENL